MKSNEQLRKEFEEQTGNKAIVFPACHGETGYASWEYQLWLEQKLLEEYAQQSQPSGMRWVRASDPPKNSNPVYIRYKHAEGYAKTLGRYCNGVWEWCDTEIEAIYPEFVLTLEWLDESSPAGAAEGASEGMAEALRKDIFRLDELRRFHIEPYNLGEMGEVSKIISRLSKLASLSPGVEDGSGWVSLVDKLPDYGTIDVWVSEYHHKGRMPNVEYRKRDFHNKSDRFEAYMHTDSGMQWVDITNMVTHWRPLPAPPGE